MSVSLKSVIPGNRRSYKGNFINEIKYPDVHDIATWLQLIPSWQGYGTARFWAGVPCHVHFVITILLYLSHIQPACWTCATKYSSSINADISPLKCLSAAIYWLQGSSYIYFDLKSCCGAALIIRHHYGSQESVCLPAFLQHPNRATAVYKYNSDHVL